MEYLIVNFRLCCDQFVGWFFVEPAFWQIVIKCSTRSRAVDTDASLEFCSESNRYPVSGILGFGLFDSLMCFASRVNRAWSTASQVDNQC